MALLCASRSSRSLSSFFALLGSAFFLEQRRGNACDAIQGEAMRTTQSRAEQHKVWQSRVHNIVVQSSAEQNQGVQSRAEDGEETSENEHEDATANAK